MSSPGVARQWLMPMPVVRVRPVGMRVIRLGMPVFVDMRFMKDACVFMGMMSVFVIVRMRMNHLFVQMRMQMILTGYQPDTDDR